MSNVSRVRSEHGYTLIELMVVVGLIGILSSMALLQIGASKPGMQSDGAMRMLMGQLNYARELAVAQRREVQVTFTGTNQITVARRELPAGTTVLTSALFEAGVQFGLEAGAGDTPDKFGNGAAIPPGGMLVFGSDGMLIDATGAPVNRSIFLKVPGQPQSLRALTVLGSTGRVRGYRWIGGDNWTRV